MSEQRDNGRFLERVRRDDEDAEAVEKESDEGLYLEWGGRRRLITGQSPAKRWSRRLFRVITRLPGMRFYATHLAPLHLRLEEVTVALPALPDGLAGLRIGLITDVHHDAGRPLALLARGVRLLNAAAPDIVLLGGDYVVSRATDFDRCAALLGRLRAPLGVYAILGNHDYWAGGDRIAAAVAAAGPTVLRNEARRLVAPGGAPFWLVGLDDAARRRHDFRTALAGVSEDEFRLLLAHEPDVADLPKARCHRFDLQLSGHTHGGQVVLPFIGSPLLPNLGHHYVRGLHQTRTHPIYTSRGLGGVPPFIRFDCPPEVTLLTLARQEARAAEPVPAGAGGLAAERRDEVEVAARS